MLLLSLSLCSWQSPLRAAQLVRHARFGSAVSIRLCADEPGEADSLLMAATTALRRGLPVRAAALLKEAGEAYSQAGGPTAEQTELLALVSARIDAAMVPGFGQTSKIRPPPPSAEEVELRAKAKAEGEVLLLRSVSAFADKEDGARFGKALELLEQARTAFRRAGAEAERERDGVMGNLYAAVRAEEERSQRVAKLVRMKKQLELVKQKRKAETLGLDEEAVKLAFAGPQGEAASPTSEGAQQGAGGAEGAAVGEPQSSSLADDILETWRGEGLDADAMELARIEREIDELEDSL